MISTLVINKMTYIQIVINNNEKNNSYNIDTKKNIILTQRKISKTNEGKTNEGKTHPPFVMRSNVYDQG